MNKDVINKICEIEFGRVPNNIIKKTYGICNEVYEVQFENGNYILRMNTVKENLYGTHKFLPVFEELKINVPSIVAEDYSMEKVPFCYQVLSKMEGADMGQVIEDLSEQELKAIAVDISSIIDKFKNLPKRETFGGLEGEKEEKYTTWLEVVKSQQKKILERNEKTGVIDEEVLEVLDWIIDEYEEYFLSVESKVYYDDMCSKNVMIHNGRFEGIVDLDFLMKGDYLEAIGRIVANWYGTDHGKIYSDEIIKQQKLNDEQINVVNMYATLNLIVWMSEEGVQFNSNTTADINWDNVKEKKEKILSLYNKINI